MSRPQTTAPETQPASPPPEVANAAQAGDEKERPPLSDHDFKVYNAMAERMDQFHEHFRSMWTVLWGAAESGKRPDDMKLADFIRLGLQFTEYLEMHHNIEEAMLFPRLAERMPQFSRDNGELVAQHKVIHEGLEGLQRYLEDCRAGRADFELRILKQKMESWGAMLWMHMDEEVKTLGANNVSKYWSKAEFSRIII